MRAREQRERAKREAGVRVTRTRFEPRPDGLDAREMLAMHDVVAAEKIAHGDGVAYRGLYVPRQLAPGTHALAITCQHQHPDPGSAVDCAKLLATLMPVRIEQPAMAES